MLLLLLLDNDWGGGIILNHMWTGPRTIVKKISNYLGS